MHKMLRNWANQIEPYCGRRPPACNCFRLSVQPVRRRCCVHTAANALGHRQRLGHKHVAGGFAVVVHIYHSGYTVARAQPLVVVTYKNGINFPAREILLHLAEKKKKTQ